MSVQQLFIKFHDAIKLSREDDTYRKAREKDDSVTADVKKAFSEAGYPVIEDFIQGSLGTHTGVKQKGKDFDIDRAVVIDAEKAPHDPVKPKIVICDDVLEKRGFKNAKVKKPCATADYASENLHIDYPVYRKSGNNYELAIGKRNSNEANRYWDSSDPKGLKDWITDKSQYGGSACEKVGQFYRIARYLKRWRDETFSSTICKKIYSIGLTVMAKECFNPVMDNEGKLNDLVALKNTVTSILNGFYFTYQGNDKYTVSATLPVTPYREIFHNNCQSTGTQFRNKLKSMEQKLSDTIAEKDEKKQCEILRELFGDDFPDCESIKKSNSFDNRRFATAGAVGTSQGA
jgi:hypothetical protein